MTEPAPMTPAGGRAGWRARAARAGLHRGHAALAVGVLAVAVWAYFVTHPLGGGAPEGQRMVPVWDVPAATVTALEYASPTSDLKLDIDWAGPDAPYLWFTATTHPKAPPPPKPPPGRKAGEMPPPPPPVTTAFKGNAGARHALEEAAGLRALRDLGRMDALKPATFGLDAPDTTLVLTRKEGEPLRLELGRSTYGNGGRYAHNPADGHVYLLRAQELRAFAGAPGALMDRDLLGLHTKDAARIVLAQAGLERTLYRLEEPGQWGPAPDATAADEDMSALAALLDRLRVARYDPAAEADPALKSPALEVRVYPGGGGEPERLTLAAPQGNRALAQSTHTRRPVEVPAAAVKQVLEKAGGLLRRT